MKSHLEVGARRLNKSQICQNSGSSHEDRIVRASYILDLIHVANRCKHIRNCGGVLLEEQKSVGVHLGYELVSYDKLCGMTMEVEGNISFFSWAHGVLGYQAER